MKHNNTKNNIFILLTDSGLLLGLGDRCIVTKAITFIFLAQFRERFPLLFFFYFFIETEMIKKYDGFDIRYVIIPLLFCIFQISMFKSEFPLALFLLCFLFSSRRRSFGVFWRVYFLTLFVFNDCHFSLLLFTVSTPKRQLFFWFCFFNFFAYIHIFVDALFPFRSDFVKIFFKPS